MPAQHFNYPNKYFIETGCKEGEGVQLALSSNHFQRIFSIEMDPHYVSMCRQRFASNPNVEILEGDSGTELSNLLQRIDAPATFYLDAHILGTPVEGSNLCPVLNELKAIGRHPIKNHTILIDDINYFEASAYDKITVDQLTEHVLKINPNYRISFIPGSVLLATI